MPHRTVDISTLVLELRDVQDFVRRTPLPGQAVEGDELEKMLHRNDDGEILDGLAGT